MNARDTILAAIHAARVPASAAPAPLITPQTSQDLVAQFLAVLPSVAATGVVCRSAASVDDVVTSRFPSCDGVLTVSARFAVAENGAVYVDAADVESRTAIVLAEHLVVTVHALSVVATMHEAVRRMPRDSTCGWFLSGPSKTADIEQSLVIGAQGARSLLVVVYEEAVRTPPPGQR